VGAPLPRLALTCGEPAGIGPDLSLVLGAEAAEGRLPCHITCLADRTLLEQRGRLLGLPLRESECFRVEDIALPQEAVAGRLDARNAGWVLRLLDVAVDGCLSGRFDAMVTAPVQKSVINDAGIPFTGHTEYLAARSHAPHPVMLLVGGNLRVALATTHLPLARVAASLSAEGLDATLAVIDRDLRKYWGIAQPRIAVCGLNPHAGEGGHLGREELELISPAIDRARRAGLLASGPWPADTLFTPRRLQECDVVLAMFHDQGLPTLKFSAFGQAVNVTLGLPLLRTSVDHGTALDLAGTGRAEAGSLLAAVRLAAQLAAAGGKAS